MKRKELIRRTAYGLGNLGYSATSQMVSAYLMFFGTSVAKISATLVGVAIAIGTLWDAVTDPLVGFISDKAKETRLGKRQTYMIFSCFGIALSNLFLWNMPMSMPMWGRFLWLLASLLSFETFDTLFATPYTALGFEISKSPHESTTIQNFKTVFSLLGMILPSICMIVFTKTNDLTHSQFSQLTYSKISIVMSSICLSTIVISALLTRRSKTNNKYDVTSLSSPEKNSFFSIIATFFSFFKNKTFKNIILGYCIAMFSVVFLSSLGMHVFTYCFHFSASKISILLLSLVLGSIISQFFINRTSKKIGKTKTLKLFLFLLIIGITMIGVNFSFRSVLSNELNFHLVLFSIFVCGIGSGALYSLPLSIFCDYVHIENEKSGKNQTATLSGLMTFCNKLSQAFGLFFVGLLLDMVSFSPAEPVQTMKVQNDIGLIMIFGIALSTAIAISFFSEIHKNKKEKQ